MVHVMRKKKAKEERIYKVRDKRTGLFYNTREYGYYIGDRVYWNEVGRKFNRVSDLINSLQYQSDLPSELEIVSFMLFEDDTQELLVNPTWKEIHANR